MYFQEAIRQFYPSVLSNVPGELLSVLEYRDELEIKQQAFALFCRNNNIEGRIESLIASPIPRGYRTTTKRRANFLHGKFVLGFATSQDEDTRLSSVLEPDEHNAIYEFLAKKLSTPAFLPLAEALNWIIIRGSYRYRVVLFNVFKMDATVVRKLKQMAVYLQDLPLKVTAAHVYFDPTCSDYYLETSRPTDALAFKSLYGPRELSLDLGKFRLKYPVTGFSQINESQIPHMLEQASRLLKVTPQHRLLDLYCGYGLFSFGIGENAGEVLGVEWEGPSIESAKDSARFLKKKNFHFMTGNINADFVTERIPNSQRPELILLDPPRKGTEPGVISALAARNPDRVLHIFCGTDEIPRELYMWKILGYKPVIIQPLDMFPGTPHLETMVLLQR
jgi:tRNA/tmRNA/rRNA uracil-C5-methylase (TrmA/RlmC/RlmD family)